MAVLIITHDLGVIVANVADEVVVLYARPRSWNRARLNPICAATRTIPI